MRRRWWLPVLAALAAGCARATAPATAPSPATPGQPATPPAKPIRDSLIIDHAARAARYVSGGKSRPSKNGRRLLIEPSDRIVVVVERTNSALYDFTIRAEASGRQQGVEQHTLQSDFGPYAAGLRTVFRPELEPARPTVPPAALAGCDAGGAVYREMLRIDRYLRGDPRMNGDGLIHVETRALQAVQEMTREGAGTDGESVDRIARAFKASLALVQGHRGQNRLALVDSLTTAIASLRDARASLGSGGDESCDAAKPPLKDLLGRADEVLKASDALLASAFGLEKLALTVASARSTVTLDTVAVSLETAVSIEIGAAPKDRPELARYADQTPMSFRLALRPDWAVVPAIGLALLYSPDSKFPTYGTTTAPGDSADIVVKSVEDRRFAWGLALSLTPFAGLRDRGAPVPWLEASINPGDDVRTVSLGGAVSWRFVKVGAGALWTKHTVLDGQTVGQRLPSAGDLKTRETYAGAEWYVGFSVFGVPSFVR